MFGIEKNDLVVIIEMVFSDVNLEDTKDRGSDILLTKILDQCQMTLERMECYPSMIR